MVLEKFLLGKRPDGALRAPAIRFSESLTDVLSVPPSKSLQQSAALRRVAPAPTEPEVKRISRLRGMMNRAKDKAKDQAQRVRTRLQEQHDSDEESDGDSEPDDSPQPAESEAGMVQMED